MQQDAYTVTAPTVASPAGLSAHITAGSLVAKEVVVRRLLPIMTVLCALGAASVAVAVPPKQTSFDVTFTNTVSDICPFAVVVTSSLSVTQRDFFDANGIQVRSEFTVTETDVFAANGHVLTGLPYHSSLHATLDPADPNHQLAAVSTGVISRVPLPNGSTFLSAGRLDFIDHPGAQFLLTPDTGRSGDVAAFCAALAP